MNTIKQYLLPVVFVCMAATLWNGCATTEKRMQPVGEQQKSELLKELDIAEQPALEPDWADYVKDNYVNWRRHYWVDRGQWGNSGYLVGKPPEKAEPVVDVRPQPPVPPVVVDSAPVKVDVPEKPIKYVVKKGDSLWRIAGKVYGNPLKWPRIYRANKEKIKNPNKIFTNQVLVVPWD